MGTMSVMGKEGDTKIIWSKGNTAEVDNAKHTFTTLRGKGFSAFGVKKDGDRGDMITEFDENLEKIIFVPPMRGG